MPLASQIALHGVKDPVYFISWPERLACQSAEG